jgi:hypothetical protein
MDSRSLWRPLRIKAKSLVRYTKETRCTCDAAARLFQRSTNQVAFVAKHFRIERKAWRQSHGVRGCGVLPLGVQ